MPRPQCLDDVIGHNNVKEYIVNSIMSGTLPHFIIFSGNTGSGKTTLARIIACLLQRKKIKNESDRNVLYLHKEKNLRKFNIEEINASDKNGIDDVRNIISKNRIMPFPPSISRVIIMDEAHQLTTPAQNALLTELEDIPYFLYYIFCTSQPNKLIAAIRRRAYEIELSGLSLEDQRVLIARYINTDEVLRDEVIRYVSENNISSPGLIVQVIDKKLGGFELLDIEGLNDSSKEFLRAVAIGNWSICAKFKIDKNETFMYRNILISYLNKVMLSDTNLKKAYKVAKAIEEIKKINEDSDFYKAVCIACTYMIERSVIP